MSLALSWDSLDEPRQLGLFAEAPAAARDYRLRWYQEEAKAAAEKALRDVERTILVMATGLGKTRSAAAIAGDWPGDVLWLAHRDELVSQAVEDLEKVTGEQVEIEQGQLSSSRTARLVVGSIQSFNQKRLDRLGRGRFGLVIVDEGHHAPARTYKRAIEWFECPRLLLTATPDRGDQKALGTIVDSCCYQFDIEDGIEQGYLVPIRGRTVELKEIDISGVAVTAGDFVAAQLDEAMLKAVAGMVDQVLRLEPDRQGIFFLPGVKSAELGCHLMN